MRHRTDISPIAAAKIACANDGLPRPLTIKWQYQSPLVFNNDSQEWFGMSDETPRAGPGITYGVVYCGGHKKTILYHSQIERTSMAEINAIQNDGGLDQYKDNLDNDAARRLCSPLGGQW